MTEVKMSLPFQMIMSRGFFIDVPSERDNLAYRNFERQVKVDEKEGVTYALIGVPELMNYSYKDHDIYMEGPCAVISNNDKKYYEALISLKRSTTFHFHKYLTELVRVRKADDSVLFTGSKESSSKKISSTKGLSTTPLKDGMILSIPIELPHGFYVPFGNNLVLELVTNDTEYEDEDIPFEGKHPFEAVASSYLNK